MMHTPKEKNVTNLIVINTKKFINRFVKKLT